MVISMRDPGRPLWAADQQTVIRSINRYQCNCWIRRSTCLISAGDQRPSGVLWVPHCSVSNKSVMTVQWEDKRNWTANQIYPIVFCRTVEPALYPPNNTIVSRLQHLQNSCCSFVEPLQPSVLGVSHSGVWVNIHYMQ